MPTACKTDSPNQKASGTKSKSRSKSLKGRSKSRSKSLKSLRKSLKSLSKSLIPSWSAKYSECPKTPSHQLNVNRHTPKWIKLDVSKDVKKKKNKYLINKLKKLPGIYVMIILKEDPSTLYLLREFKDLFYGAQIDYQGVSTTTTVGGLSWDDTIGHSSIYTKPEFTIEWLKEQTARKHDLDASKESNPTKKKELRRSARRTREQCLLYFAGQLYYDKELVVWTNHSGHFQTKEYVKRKVGLPLDKFAPMSSKKIHTMIEQHYS